MAELAVSSIATSLLKQLSSPAKDQVLLWYNSKSEQEKLKNTITSIKGVMHDVEQRKATDTEIGGWLSRLQDEMYKADDLFDVISTKALRKRVISGNRFKKEIMVFFSKSNPVVFAVKAAYKVKELREQLDSIAKDISQFGLIRSRTEYGHRTTIRRKAQHSYITEDEVIGRGKDKEELLRLLLADVGVGERVSVVAVVGIGGQGKTALAQLLYNSKEIEEFFGLRLWACVHNFLNLEEALQEITGTRSHSLDELQNRLRAKIHGKKFILVIDDVWDDIREHWLCLKLLLDAGERGSKVLVTTRSQTVAQNLATAKPSYALSELSDEDAWILFKKMAFDCNNKEEDQAKEELGRRIFKKCPKVPLAIRTVGSFLYSKDKKQWSAFVDNELMKAMPGRDNIVMQVLKISYEDLPSSLKHCFAYCSLFPKDHKFDKITLIHLWMAQGLLETCDEHPCLEDVGESYFLYLVQRGFFQNVEVDDDSNVKSCKMHDLFHDLSVQVSANECLMMLRTTDDLGGKFLRHLLVKEIKVSLLQYKRLRSLVSPDTGFVERALLHDILLNLTSLRTLSLRQLDMEKIPSSIGKLVHLRYLDLKNSRKLNRLPDAICKLQNLLILRLEGCRNIIKLPHDLQKLISLRCLKTAGCEKLKHIPSRLEKMTSLVTLDQLIVHSDHGGLRWLKHLNNLTGDIFIKLPRGGWKNCAADAEESMLNIKTKLSRLSILWSSAIEGEEFPEANLVLERLRPSNNISHLKVDSFIGTKFPDWLSSLRSLVYLALVECGRCHELPQLRQLFQLKRLVLGSLLLPEYVETDICYDRTSFFPSLEYLEITRMPRLKGWWKPIGEDVCNAYDLWFPQLSRLQVFYCPLLTSLPLCPCVKDLTLENVNANLVTQLVRLREELELEPSNSSTYTCSKLNDLCLRGINDLAFLPDDFKHMSFVRCLSICGCPNYERSSLLCLLQHLPSLESLECRGFHSTEILADLENMARDGLPWRSLTRLKELDFEFGSDPLESHLVNGLYHLTRLENLKFYMNKAAPNDAYIQWTFPPNLKHLSILFMERVAGLNSAIHQLKNLQSLTIKSCDIDEHELNKLLWEDLKGLRKLVFYYLRLMKSLPENCRHLQSLEDLHIFSCREIASLPDWIRNLTSLEIYHCSKLKEACRKPIGSCWHLIRDIPYYSISD